jgi:hypothetical protein
MREITVKYWDLLGSVSQDIIVHVKQESAKPVTSEHSDHIMTVTL